MAMLRLLFLLYLFSPFECEHVSKFYNGFNYTYAGDQVGDYRQSLDWCTRMGGQLPAVHSQADIDFLADDLVGEQDHFDSMWLGARRFHDSWKWNDNSPFDIVTPIHTPPNNDYGIILQLGAGEKKKLQIQSFADPTKRRVACRVTGPSSQWMDELGARTQVLQSVVQQQNESLSNLYQELVSTVNNMTDDKIRELEGLVDRKIEAHLNDKQSKDASEEMQTASVSEIMTAASLGVDEKLQKLDRWLIVVTVFVVLNTISLMLLVIHFIISRRSKRQSKLLSKAIS